MTAKNREALAQTRTYIDMERYPFLYAFIKRLLDETS